MIATFVKRPAMTVMFVLVFVVMGIVSFSNLIIERTPKMDFPLVVVKSIYNGASPAEVEAQIVKKVEDAVAEISEIKSIKSNAYEGYGYVLIEFEMGADVNLKSMEVKDKVEAITNDLPTQAEKPVVSKFDPLVTSIIDLVLVSDKSDSLELYEYADKVLRNQLTVIEGVASVDIYGGKKRQINVDLDPIQMQMKFVTIDDVVNTIAGHNVTVPGGYIDKTDNRSSVKLNGEFSNVNDIRKLIIPTRDGYKTALSDISLVEDGYEKIENYTRYNGRNVVGLSILKLSDGDAVSIVKRIKSKLGSLNLPKDYKIEIAYDSTENVLKGTYGTIYNILFGIILTILILFFFLEDLRVTAIAAIVIPTSLISTFFLMNMFDYTINFVTLLAIGTSLGTLIANALVVIESIDQKLAKGMKSVDAAIQGTKDAFVAVLASAGTNLVVFTPIAIMGGMVGKFMSQFGMTVIFATIFSLFASFTLTPMLCGLMLKGQLKKMKRKKSILQSIILFPQKLVEWSIYEYKILFKKIFKHPIITFVFCGICFVSLLYPLRYIGNEFFPSSDQDAITIGIEMPQGTLLDKTLSVTKQVENIVKDLPEVSKYISYIGSDGATENATIKVTLISSDDRKRSDLDLINYLIPKAAEIPDADISFVRGEGSHSSDEGDVSINLYGKDYDKMVKVSNQMKQIMEKCGYFRSVFSSYKNPKDEIQFIPNQESMLRLGVRNNYVGNIIRYSVNGNDDNIYKEKGEEYRIDVRLSETYKKTVEDVDNILIMTKDGLVPLYRLGHVITKKGFSTIKRRDKKRAINVGGYLSKSTSGQVQMYLDQEFKKKIDFGDDLSYAYVGMAEMQEESAREISKAFILAVIFTYMLLTAIMDSFVYPFVIMAAVLTSFIGVFYFLFFAGFSINIGSMMAIVMVVGLVVNNAILMLDYTLVEMRKGTKVKDALWLGAENRFRSIVMTSLAVIFGSLPQIFDKEISKASMGGVVIGGMLGSIFFTFILIPVLFYYVVKIQEYVKKKLK